MARQIEVRQRPLKDDARAFEARQIVAPAFPAAPFDPSRRVGQLFLTVAQDEDRMGSAPASAAGASSTGGSDAAGRRGLLDLRQRIVQPLVPARRQHPFRGDDVDAFDAGHASQQIEVRRPQAARPCRLIGDGDHDVAIRLGSADDSSSARRACSSIRAAVGDAPFERRKRRGKELRLLEQPFRASIRFAAGGELLADEAIEAVDRPAAAPQLVVEREDRGHESRPQAERRRRPLRACVVRRQPQQHFALELGQQRRSVAQVDVQLAVQLAASDEIGKDERTAGGGRQAPVLDRAAQLLGGAAARDDDRRRTRRPALRDRVDDGLLE